MTPFPDITFINEEATGCINEEAIDAINEEAIDAIIVSRNQSSCFFISCFTISVVPSIKIPDFPSDSMILLASSISSSLQNESFSCSYISSPTYFPFKFI